MSMDSRGKGMGRGFLDSSGLDREGVVGRLYRVWSFVRWDGLLGVLFCSSYLQAVLCFEMAG